MKITATNKATGEVIELDANTPKQIVEAWRVAQEYDKAATALKDQLKKLVPAIISEKGTSEPIGNYQFRVSNIQRMIYDKTTLRNLIKDEDFYDTLVKPDKALIDKLLQGDQKKGIDPDPRLWAVSHELRESMIADGNPYQVIKLERVSREEN